MKINVFNTETTGLLQPENSDLTMQPKITEIYIAQLDEEFNLVAEYNQMINVGEPLSKEITRITGITDDMLKDKPMFAEVADDISEFFNGCDLSVAHNHGFDSGMLDVEYKRLDSTIHPARHRLCTVECTMGMTGHRLSLTRLHWMLLQEQFKAHRAKDDVFALVRCLHQLTEKGIVDFEHYKN